MTPLHRLSLPFTKLEGARNDYVFLDVRHAPLPIDPGALARAVSDRRAGIGSDGLILAAPSERGVCRMQMFNVDGTPGEMCGNGLRCLAKWAYDSGWTGGAKEFVLESAVGLHAARIVRDDGPSAWVEVELGAPCFEPERIPVLPDRVAATPQIDVRFEGATYTGHAVSFGNPHVVFFLASPEPRALDEFPLERFGPLVERDARFPARVNVEVAQLDERGARQRTWERGSAETWACGSGACAIAAVAARLGRPRGALRLELRGGALEVELGERTLLRGPATEVFRGEWRVWAT
ncbi:MAG: diaminopimelate epimerase [Planctomycetes bacterium]|nr:diaminopimelate epimerase [Planctomycetota bacterium]